MRAIGCLSILLMLAMLVLLPVAFANLLGSALTKLRLTHQAAVFIAMAILFGGLVNIPVKRIVRTELVEVDPLAVFGLAGFWPQLRRQQQETILAVNVGGCVVPTCLAGYEAFHLLSRHPGAVTALVFAVLINTIVCYRLARPVRDVGIVMPALVPPIVSAGAALLLAPDHGPPIAFAAGVLGTLIGADLLHLREFERLSTGIASIGGAGTFDGIVLSGIVAVYLA